MIGLNRRQRIVLLAIISAVGLMGLYPPWIGLERTHAYSPVSEYGWIFSPPTLPDFLLKTETFENMAKPEIGPYCRATTGHGKSTSFGSLFSGQRCCLWVSG